MNKLSQYAPSHDHCSLNRSSTDTSSAELNAATCFGDRHVTNNHFSEMPVTTVGTDQEYVPQLSVRTRLMGVFAPILASIPIIGRHVKPQSSPEREADTLARLKKIMPQEAFDSFQKERSKTVSNQHSGNFFSSWYNQNKFDPVLENILTDYKDTKVVKALKSQIAQYEIGALEELTWRTRKDSISDCVPQCLSLKSEDLFDKHNNYLIPNPKMEITADEIEEVLTWYCRGINNKMYDGNGRSLLIHHRTLEDSSYSESAIAHKLKKCLAVREQRALIELEKLMPKESFKEFQALMEKGTAQELEIKSSNPLVNWYNSCADSNPEFLKPWCDDFSETKAKGAYDIFLRNYEAHAKHKFKEVMGDSIYNSCYVQLCHLLPMDVLARAAAQNNELDQIELIDNVYTNIHQQKVFRWRSSLTCDQWQQLRQSEVRNSKHMIWLSNIIWVINKMSVAK